MIDDDFDGFEWDEAKSSGIFSERGVSLEAAARIFTDCYVEREDARHDYGEQRYIVTGMLEGVAITVVWTPRGRNRRLITAWPATSREERDFNEYRKANEQGNSGEQGRN